MKKVWVKWGLAVAMVLGLVGCGKAQEKQVIIWNPFTGSDGDYFQEMVDAYNKTDPEITIKNVVIPDMYTKINTVMNSKKDTEVPDLTIMHAERVALFQSQKMLSPMTAILKKQKNIKAANYIQQAWSSGEVKGVRYTVPLDVHSSVLFYNKDLVEKYDAHALDDGVITLKEIEAITQQAKADKKVTYPINLEHWTAMSFMTELGGQLEKNGEPTLDTPQMRQAVGVLKHLVEIGAAQEDGDDPVQLFQAGDAVFLQDGTWGIAGHKKIKGLHYGITNTPAIEGTTVSNWTSSHQFALLKKERSAKKEAAIGDFIEFVRKHSDVWAESGQNVASKVVYESPEYKKNPQAFLLEDPKEMATLKIYDFKNNGITLDALGAQVRDMIYGRKKIKTGLQKAQKEVEDKLEKSSSGKE